MSKSVYARIAAITAVVLGVLFVSLFLADRLHKKSFFTKGVAVLMYHHVDDHAQSGNTVTTSLFREQLAYLKNKGYQFITFQQFRSFMEGDSVPDNAVLVTFDDGYESYYLNAYPIMKELDVPSVNFIITKELENPRNSKLPFLSREQIVEMTNDGDLVEVQSHTDSLHSKVNNKAFLTARFKTDNREETEEEYHNRLYGDLQTSVEKLKPLQSRPVDSLAYPFGIYNKAAMDSIRQTDIRYAFTVHPGIAAKDMDPLQLPRINAGSPWISPQILNETIRCQIFSFKEPLDKLPLRSVMEQIGGAVLTEGDKQILLFEKKKWIIQDQATLIDPNENTINLSKPMVTKRGRTYISAKDFMDIFGSMVVYDKNTKRFYSKKAIVYEE